MTVTLDTLRPGEAGIVAGLSGDDEATDRLMEMGLIEGTHIQVVRYAPLGDPMEIAVRGYHLTLRRTEAAAILVETE